MGTLYVTVGGSEVPVPIAQQAPFPPYNAGITYQTGQVVSGSDLNLYRCLSTTTGVDPTTDSGTHWELWYLRYSIILNCGAGQRFGGSITDPAGIQQAINFIANAVGAASPSTATITIQVANNPTGICSANGSTTTLITNAQVPVGASIQMLSGTAANIGQTGTVTGVSGSGPYTYTVSSLPTTTASSDTFAYSYHYGANTITINLPMVGANVTVQGAVSTVAAPMFFPTVSDGGVGGSFAAGTYYVAVTYTWMDSSGVTRETQPGPVTSQSISLNHGVACSGFTLPPGATGANLYASNIAGGVLHKQAAFSISSGVASALTISSYNSAGANGASINPPAVTYPCALTWSASVAKAIDIQNTSGTPMATLTLSGFYLYGNGSSTAQGIRCLASAVISTPMVISGFMWGINATNSSCVSAASVQVDQCSAGFLAQQKAYLTCANSAALRCTNTGYFGTLVAAGIYAASAFAGFSSTGFTANYGAYIETTPTNPSAGIAVPTYGSTAASAPAFNSVGNNNSYISNI